MSDAFSADWLALREPADHRARDPGLLATLAVAMGDRPVTVVDLGCGAGSNLRALAPVLPTEQAWRLVDHDEALLARSRETIAIWADSAKEDGERLVVRKEGKRLSVSFHRLDLSGELDEALGTAPDLVTAAALFDLFSADAIEAVAAAVVRRRAFFYTALTYDGREEWRPRHSRDVAILAAFLEDLARDKGFGPSAGHRATGVLEAAFVRSGYAVRTAASAWRLEEDSAPLRIALAEGIAGAVSASLPAQEVESWLALRRVGGAASIGHQDLLALPQ